MREMSEKQKQLFQLAKDIYAESDKIKTRQEANYSRKKALSKIQNQQDRNATKQYVEAIGRRRSINAARAAHRQAWKTE